ncbi:ATP-binding cassette sub-family C member 9-like, partial [Limulus polyphemus]|uniref:ATP-binding cassette sub-family C member 9-like n=1 Tax=Limulus polyphemus TaxID=6850 RepID=A0ABM1BYL3_LIMPO
MEDLGDLPEADQAENQFKRFYHIYFKEKLAAEKAGKVVSLWKCYWLTFWKTLALGGMMKMVGDLVGLVGPMAINIIVLYAAAIQEGTLSKPDPTKRYHPTTWEFLKNGYVTSVVVLVATFMQSTFSNNFNHLAITEGVHLRSALQCLVYKKALKISGIAGIDTGTVVNHMSVDAFNMMMLFSMGHYIWAVPFKITLLLMLLYMQLGYSALIGAATIYVLAPVQYYICTLLSRIQKEALKVADERLQRTSELLQGIKLLKLYGWETMYGNLIQNVREKELKLLRSDAIYVALNTFLTQASSIVVTLVTFALYSTIEGKPLASSEVFTGLALFNQLTVPLYIIPFVIPIVINAMVSTKRLRHFLQMSEVDSNTPWREQEGPAAIVEYNPDSGSVLLNVKDAELERKRNILGGSDESDGVFLPELMNQPTVDGSVAAVVQNGSFTWDFNSSISVLQDIHVQIPAVNSAIETYYSVSGRHAQLLSKELWGNVQISVACTPSVAYVPQKAWLLNATLKENILFGQPYDGR